MITKQQWNLERKSLKYWLKVLIKVIIKKWLNQNEKQTFSLLSSVSLLKGFLYLILNEHQGRKGCAKFPYYDYTTKFDIKKYENENCRH